MEWEREMSLVDYFCLSTLMGCACCLVRWSVLGRRRFYVEVRIYWWYGRPARHPTYGSSTSLNALSLFILRMNVFSILSVS